MDGGGGEGWGDWRAMGLGSLLGGGGFGKVRDGVGGGREDGCWDCWPLVGAGAIGMAAMFVQNKFVRLPLKDEHTSSKRNITVNVFTPIS